MIRNINLLLIVLSIVFSLGGCAGRAVVETTGVELARAEAMIRAAELSGGDELAPLEMVQARQDLQLAKDSAGWEPKTGSLSRNIQKNSDLKQQTSESIRSARENAELAIRKADAEKQRRAEPSPERIKEIRSYARQEVASEVREEVKEEVRAEVEQEVNRSAPVLPPLKFVSIRGDLYRAIRNEFGPELAQWEMAVDRQYLTVGFTGTATSFKSGSTWVNRKTRRVIEKFFPRFVKVLMRPEFRDQIKEIRIEGFSSTNYDSADSAEEKDHLNLLLSQERTANMMRFILQQPGLKNNRWLVDHLLPVGFDGKNPVLNRAGVEDEVRSRRVDFRVILEQPHEFR